MSKYHFRSFDVRDLDSNKLLRLFLSQTIADRVCLMRECFFSVPLFVTSYFSPRRCVAPLSLPSDSLSV